MNPLLYIKLAGGAAALAFCWYLGYSFEHSRFLAYKADQVIQTQKQERAQQSAADQIRKQKDAQIASINNQLVDAISQLRKRPSRAQDTSNGACGTGATLSAEDAEFLVREAARADQIRTGLQACYAQYEAVAK